MKTCTRCEQTLPLSAFALTAKGYRSRCRECVREADREQYHQRKQYAPWWRRRRVQIAAAYRRRVETEEGLARQRETWRRDNRRRAVLRRRDTSRLMPAGPFQDWLAGVREEFAELQACAEHLGLSDKTIREHLKRERKWISEDLVDRATLRDGRVRLDDLYPAEVAA